MNRNVYIEDISISCSLGSNTQEILSNLRQGVAPGMQPWDEPLYSGRSAFVSRIIHSLDNLAPATYADNRNNRLAHYLVNQLKAPIAALCERYGKHRIGVVIGSSTSGIEKTEPHVHQWICDGTFPDDYNYQHQDMGDVALVIRQLSGVTGPAYTVSTACTSSARALISATKLIRAGVCDAVISGGVDTLCHLTVNGFDSLEQVSDKPCRPFDESRSGINVAEGGALLILSERSSDIELAGFGESADAYHLSSPKPCGSGAILAMRAALDSAEISPDEVDYINAHGTSTLQNDVMESTAIYEMFTSGTPVSSTKALTGHCLGASGAVEASISCLLLRNPNEPLPRQWPIDRQTDSNLCPIALVETTLHVEPKTIISNSFAFGGNNAALVFQSTK